MLKAIVKNKVPKGKKACSSQFDQKLLLGRKVLVSLKVEVQL